MCRRLNQLVIWLLVASLAHLPLPVWDGDDVGTRGAVAGGTGDIVGDGGTGVATLNPYDVDLILLGCDPPADCDDGPAGDHPDDSTLDVGLGPAFRAASAVALADPLDWSSLFTPGPPHAAAAIWQGLAATSGSRGDGGLVHAAHPRPATTVLRL